MPSFTHSHDFFIHSLHQPFTHFLTLTCSPTHSHFLPQTHYLACCLTYVLTKSVMHVLSSSLIHKLTCLLRFSPGCTFTVFRDLHSHFLSPSHAISLTRLYAHLLAHVSVTHLFASSLIHSVSVLHSFITYLLKAANSIAHVLSQSPTHFLSQSESSHHNPDLLFPRKLHKMSLQISHIYVIIHYLCSYVEDTQVASLSFHWSRHVMLFFFVSTLEFMLK